MSDKTKIEWTDQGTIYLPSANIVDRLVVYKGQKYGFMSVISDQYKPGFYTIIHNGTGWKINPNRLGVSRDMGRCQIAVEVIVNQFPELDDAFHKISEFAMNKEDGALILKSIKSAIQKEFPHE